MVTVHQSSVVLGTGSTFFVPQGEFYYFLCIYIFYGLTLPWVQEVFFLACDICDAILVGLKADISLEPRSRVAKPRENDNRFLRE